VIDERLSNLLIFHIQAYITIDFDSKILTAQLPESPKDPTLIVERGRVQEQAIDCGLGHALAWLQKVPMLVIEPPFAEEAPRVVPWGHCPYVMKLE
jgi:hypothetical protein